MSPFAIGVIAGLIFLQASIAAPREKFGDCLQKASLEAAAQQVAPDQYSAYASQQCASAGNSYKSALINFDVKNGIKRVKAAADAKALIDDEVALSAEKYEARAPKAKQAATPQPIEAAAPAKPKGD